MELAFLKMLKKEKAKRKSASNTGARIISWGQTKTPGPTNRKGKIGNLIIGDQVADFLITNCQLPTRGEEERRDRRLNSE